MKFLVMTTLSLLSGNSHAVLWLRLCTSTSGVMSFIPGQGTKILHAVRHSQKKQSCISYEKSLFYSDAFANMFLQKCFILNEIHGKDSDKYRSLVLKSICLHVGEAIMHLPSAFPNLLAQSHIM